MKRFERKAQSQRKHGPLSVSSASKAPIAPPTRQPGWNGPGYHRKAARQTSLPNQDGTIRVQEQTLLVELQQLILDIFRSTFPASNDFDALKPKLREIRDALAQGDFATAFGTEEFVEAYGIRWSPSKALLYSNLLAWVCRKMNEDEWVQRLTGDDETNPANVLCFGGGTAELMAFAVLLKQLRPSMADEASQPSLELPEMDPEIDKESNLPMAKSARANVPVHLRLVDTTNWAHVISKLHLALITPPALSKYASARAQASNASALPSQALTWKFTQVNILECGTEDLRSMIGPNPALLTLFSTLSKLYSISISKTTAFLLRLSAVAPKGSLLLVVDSPGAFSAAVVESDTEEQGKRYPINWLMYQALFRRKKLRINEGDGEEAPVWSKLIEEDNSVFKLAAGLRFPVSLENTKFQMHLLKRL